VKARVAGRAARLICSSACAALNSGCSGISWDGNCLAYSRFLIGGLF
jgi:hypothetical protein